MEQVKRVAIITGASRGIGRAVAIKLAEQRCQLVLNYHKNDKAMEHTKQLCIDAGARVVVVGGDVAQASVVEELVDQALSHFERIDILVNNAAVAIENLVLMLSDEELEQMLATNIVAVVRLSRAVLKTMVRQRSGNIVNLSSVVAQQAGRGNAVYSGTKGFVESFTRSLAMEVGSKNVRVNAVAPGVIETDMSKAIRAVASDAIRGRMALKQFGKAEQVAATVAFVVSEAAAFMTGAVVPVDGGYD